MDFTEVNFELTEGQTRQNDEQTFRELFEFIAYQVNQPIQEDYHDYSMYNRGSKSLNNWKETNQLYLKDC